MSRENQSNNNCNPSILSSIDVVSSSIAMTDAGTSNVVDVDHAPAIAVSHAEVHGTSPPISVPSIPTVSRQFDPGTEAPPTYMSPDIPVDVLSHADSSQSQLSSPHSRPPQKHGRILLVGSGPGHPSLLTIATHTALTQWADLVLSDKLVPNSILALIPKHVCVRIAKKFPGNVEAAQTEMMEAAVEAANQGLTVVRLKQGDPVIYGRAGEEILYFRSHGFEPLVIPGVSSALAAPTFAGIPITQRGVSESFIVCTGVGRKGKDVLLPGYVRGRTLILLMGVARLSQLVTALMDTSDTQTRREGVAFPPYTPIAIIERASMPDQRVITSTLKDIVKALESNGEQKPPGTMVIGWSVLALNGEGDVTVLDDYDYNEVLDEERVLRWLGGRDAVGWRVQEGLDERWEGFEGMYGVHLTETENSKK